MTDGSDGVVLLHGISRTTQSFRKMEPALEAAGFPTLNQDYASRNNPWKRWRRIVVATSHPWLVRNDVAIAQTIAFLKNGKFRPGA